MRFLRMRREDFLPILVGVVTLLAFGSLFCTAVTNDLGSLSDPWMIGTFVLAVLFAAFIPLFIRTHLRRLLDDRTRGIRADNYRLERQRAAILRIANSSSMFGKDLQGALRELTEIAAMTLGVERVSVWQLHADGSVIECQCEFEKSTCHFSSGQTIVRAEFPTYFEAIRHSRILVADDVSRNPYTSDFKYLQEAGVTSMLDAPIYVNGALFGIVCHEHVGPRRRWTLDEQNFACSVADMVAMACEVNERRKIENELRRKSQAIDASLEGIAIIERDETFSFVNPALARLFGYARPEELIGQNWRVLYSSQELRNLERHVRVSFLREGNLQCEALGLRQDRSMFSQELSLTALGDGSLVCIVRDITQRKEAERQLVGSRKFLRKVIDTDPNLIFVKDSEGHFALVNQAVADVYGTTVEDLIGKKDSDFNSDPAQVEGYRRDDLAVIDSGRKITIQEEVVTDKSGRERILHTVKLPLEIPGKNGVHVLGVATDITQQRMLHDQLVQAQKMEALGQLAGGIAHDFNNLMTGVLGYTTLIKLDSSDRPEVYRSAEVIEQAATRAAELTQKLLGFARKGKHQNAPVNIHHSIDETLSIIRRTIAPSIALETDFGATECHVLGDPVQLQQIILNLAINARDAMSPISGGTEGGKLSIRTSNIEASEVNGDARMFFKLEVTDTGCGVPDSIRERIFEPFFSTKDESQGSGLGLAMVYGIVCNHGGSIFLQSSEGQGASFVILLPITTVSLGQRVEASIQLPARGKGTILVVDDHDVVRSATSEMLQSLGYVVFTASDGVEAIEVFTEHVSKIDLVLLDVVMPRMGASECLAELRKLNNAVRVIISTGYVSSATLSQLLETDGVVGFVSKPFQLTRLSALIAEALSGTPREVMTTPPTRIRLSSASEKQAH